MASGVAPEFSVVIPMKDEEGNAEELLRRLETACSDRRFEAVVVDDGSSDRTAEVVRSLRARYAWLRLLRHETSAGQSAAVWSGVRAAHADIIATMDGDGQNPPEEIPRLIDRITAEDKPFLVAGQRVGRKDTIAKRLASKFANRLRGAILKDNTRDSGCGLKAFRRASYLDLPYFNHMHRFLPALFNGTGLSVTHIDVAAEPRSSGKSKYTNLGRALVGIWDLFGVAWLLRRQAKPAVEEDR